MTTNPQLNNPLHGITLETILKQLVKQHGWLELGERIPIKCFTDNASIKSSLKFLRQTPWARKKVEDLYLKSSANEQNMDALET
ncbi:MAG: VF530 family protein [Anaerolineales bacterium]